MMLVQPVPDEHALDLQQARQDARPHAAAHLLFACFEQLQPRFEPVDVVAQRVDAVQEFLGLGAARHVAAFFLQILGDVLQRTCRAARRAKPSAERATLPTW